MTTKLEAWWAHKQGLDGELAGESAAAVLEKTGWARSVGGAAPYLTLFARAGTTREAVDKAAAGVAIHELPSARGCTYVLPARDFALGLRCGQGFADEADLKLALKLGVNEAEIDRLCAKVSEAVAKEPRDPEELRDACGSFVRNLGAEGKKRGLTTTLPVALGRLQQRGEIRRVPVNGRLDQQRYKYTLWKPSPLAGNKWSKEEAYTELARRYFAWIGPATLAEFQWFSGLGVKVSREAVEPLWLVSLPSDPERLMLREDFDRFEEFRVPKEPRYAVASSLDGLCLLRRNVKDLLAPEDAGLKLVSSVADLPDHAIFDRGRLIGLWAFDVERGEVAWMTFAKKKDKALVEAVRKTEAFVRDQLGDARSFSLDSPKSRGSRIEALRKAGGQAP